MLSKKKENVSTIMLLPVLKIDKKLVNSFYSFGFVKTYIWVKDLEYKWKNVMMIEFKPDRLDSNFNEFLFDLSTSLGFLEVLDIGHKRILLVFKISDQFREDFELFLEGYYSKLSNSWKNCFSLQKPVKNSKGEIRRDISGGIMLEPSMFAYIFNKSQKLRDIYKERLGLDDLPEDLELYDKVDKEKETLTNIILF